MTDKEEIAPRFTADHHGFYNEGHSFFPLIQDDLPLKDWSNVAVIRLPAGLRDDLNWDSSIQLARAYQAANKFILWELDLELDRYCFDPHDSAAFFSFTVALDEFKAHVWPQFSRDTFGVILYRGVFCPEMNFRKNQWESAFLEWKKEMDNVGDYSLYCLQNFAEYLHRLVSFLPDAVLAFVLIDTDSIGSPAKTAHFFSKQRFEHIQLILKGAQCAFAGITYQTGQIAHGWMGDDPFDHHSTACSTIGIYLPKDSFIDDSVLENLNALINSLNQTQMSYRIVCEEKLTEHWDGLDKIIVPATVLSSQGRRKLLGFAAAGGEIVSMDGSLGFPDEKVY